MQDCNSHKSKELFRFPDAVFLDMDNTLYDYQYCHNKALKQVGKYLKGKAGIQPSAFHRGYSIARKQINSRLSGTASSHNRLLYFQHLLETGGYGTRVDLALKAYDLYWNTFIKNIRIFNGVIKFLKFAKKSSIPVVLITDLTADVQFKKIRCLKFQDKFDIIVTSEEAGSEKPDTRIFKLALKKLGRPVRTIWMIGDSYSQDIVGGKALGAMTFHKVNGRKNIYHKGSVKPNFVFSSFNMLTDILKSCTGKCQKYQI